MRLVNGVVAVVAVLGLAGCGQGGSDPVELPGGSELMITWNVTGGFAPVGLGPADAPRLAIYSDGRAIAGAAKVLTLPKSELTDLVRRVRDQLGGQPPQVRTGSDMRVADGQDTTIGIRASSGAWQEVSAYAIDIDPDGFPERLVAANTALRDVAGRVKDEGEEYTADRVRLAVLPLPGTELAKPWPAAITVPTEPAPSANRIPSGARRADLSGDAAAAVVRAFGDDGRGGYDRFRLPDGSLLNMAWRYLLPHE